MTKFFTGLPSIIHAFRTIKDTVPVLGLCHVVLSVAAGNVHAMNSLIEEDQHSVRNLLSSLSNTISHYAHTRWNDPRLSNFYPGQRGNFTRREENLRRVKKCRKLCIILDERLPGLLPSYSMLSGSLQSLAATLRS